MSTQKLAQRHELSISGACSCEPLETRRMLADFHATAGNDQIEISDTGLMIQIVVNGGTPLNTPATDINIHGDGGSDTFRFLSTRTGVVIRALGDDGNDLMINPGTRDLDVVYRGPTIFLGGAGTDKIIADNSLDSTTPVNIDIVENGILKSGQGAVMLWDEDELEELEYIDSGGSNRIGFVNMRRFNEHDITFLTIRANGGNDVITNTESTNPNTGMWRESVGSGGAFIDGGTGTDTLRFNDSLQTQGNWWTINSTSILADRVTCGPMAYANSEAMNFVGSPGNEQVDLTSKPADTTFHFDSGNGVDSFLVGGGDFDLNGFKLANTTLLGGTGADSIQYQDSSDFASDTYTWNAALLSRTTFGFNATSFETRTLFASNGLTISAVNTINLDSCESGVTGTTIYGNGGGAGTSIVNVTQGNLANLLGLLDVDADKLNINDQTSGGPANGYQVSSTFVRKNNTNQTINYSRVGQLTLNTSGVFDVVSVSGTGAGTSLFLNTNAGDDTINVGGGNLDVDFGAGVTVNGGTGVNTATLSNASDTSLESQTLNGSTFTDGFSYTFSSVNTLGISTGAGGTNLNVNSTTIPTNLIGGAGNDTFNVGGGDIDSNFQSGVPSGLVINGQGGTDSIYLNDLNDPNLNSYFINTTRLDLSDAGIHWFVFWSNVEGVTLDASNGTSAQQGVSSLTLVEDTLIPLRLNGNGGNDWLIINDAAAPVFAHTGLGDKDMVDVNQDFDAGPATVIFDQTDDVETLTIYAGGVLRVTDGATLVKTRAATSPGSMSINGVLDLAGGSLLSRAGGPSLASFQTLLTRGYNGGAWNGTHASGAINSSLAAASSLPDAVGYGLGSEIAISTIGGFNVNPGDTLIRYTFYGDADLNGVVDFDDYVRTDTGYNNNRTGWTNGDFNYDNLIDFDDYVLIDTAFNGQ